MGLTVSFKGRETMLSLRLAASIAATFVLSACAYNVTPTTAPAVNIYSSYEKKVPGRWAIVLDDSVRTLRRDVKPATYICSAHSYPIDAGGALSSSLRRTFEQVADDTVSKDSIPSPQAMQAEGLTGSIFVKLDEFQPRLSCQQGFWAGTCSSTVDISIGTIIRAADGQTLLSTSAGSSRTADGGAGPACGDAGQAMSEATSRAMKDALERLAERMANSTALRAPAPAIAPARMPTTSAAMPSPPLAQPVVAPAPISPQPLGASPSVATQGVKPAAGAESRYMVSAERFAKANGCPAPAAAMILKAPFNETFSVTCPNGSTILVRCENDACRGLN
jgi:hypothetical protein